MSKKQSLDLLKDPVKSLIFKLSIPLMLAGLLRTSYSFIDMIFASHLGGVQIASVAFVSPLFMMLQALGNGIALGGISLIAKSLGKGDKQSASEYAAQLRSLILLIAVIISLLGFSLSRGFLQFLGISGDLLDQSYIYTRILFFSIPFLLIVQLYMSLYKAQGKMKMTTLIALVGVAGNSLLNSLLIIGLGMGIEGLAYGTLLTQIVQAFVIFRDYHRNSHDFEMPVNPFSHTPDFKKWNKLFRVGFPLSFSTGSTQFGFLLINALIAPLGYQVVAGFAIGNRINSLFFSPAMGIGQAMVPLLAQNWGARLSGRIREAVKSGLTFAVLYGIAGALFIQILTRPLGSFLSQGDEVILAHVTHYLRLMAWTLIAWCIFESLSGVFNGFQKTKISMYISIIRLWGIRIPGILIFRFLLPSYAEYGVWYTMFLSNMVAAVFLCNPVYYIFPRINL